MPLKIPGPTSRIYFSQRLRLHYVDWGNPDAPPLLLVHGWPDSFVRFLRAVPLLADRFDGGRILPYAKG